MATHKLSDSEIRIRVVPTHLRWPETGTTIAWTRAHDCVDALQDLVRNVDLDCLQTEQNKELSASAIRRRRAEICDQAMTKLTSFTPFQVAEKVVIENIALLERLTDRDPEQVKTHQKLTKALKDLQEGVAATGRMLLERCEMREGGDGQFRV